MRKKTLIIAEAGVNHNGELGLAYELIDAAADAGADYVKFQTFVAARQVTLAANKAEYQKVTTGSAESQFDMLSKLELTEAMHRQLIAHCAKRNIRFLSTAFDIQSVDLLIRLGQEIFKIPSGEITNLPYLRHVGSHAATVILSTGMSDLSEITAAIEVLELAGTKRSNITALHCTTAYPTPLIEVNLSAMKTLAAELHIAVGYSDHTLGIEVPVAAVAMGAQIIEKHFTLNRNSPGPDHKASLEPSELKAMVCAIRNIEMALGDGVKRMTESEIQNMPMARKSIVASQSINSGEIFTVQNLTVKRPGTGVSPMLWDQLIGTKAKKNYLADELIQL
jgi:N,N'-diacetyllegionaminate synthase